MKRTINIIVIFIFIFGRHSQAESLKDISNFAKEICDDIRLEGSIKKEEIVAKLTGEISGVAKLLGGSVNAEGDLVIKNTEYKGLPYETLPAQMKDTRACKKEMAKMLIEERKKIVSQPINKKLSDALRKYKYEIQWTGGLGEKLKIPRTAKIMDLAVDDSSVEISYKYDDFIFTIKGVAKGFISENSINGTWTEDGMRGPGTFKFEFNKDFSKAEGWWQLATNSTKNSWYLHRIK